MIRPALKAGLIGGLAVIILNQLASLPGLGCISFLLELLAFGATGALAASWWVSSTSGGSKAGAGAFGGAIAGLVSGAALMVIAPLSYTAAGGGEAVIAQLPPESLQQLRSSGLDPSVLLGPGTIMAVTGLCCGFNLMVGALLGALGGLLYPSERSRNRRQWDTASSPAGLGQFDPLPDQLPDRAASPALEGVNTNRALDAVIALAQRSSEGNPSNLERLLPYLRHFNPVVRSLAARSIGEYLAVIERKSQDQQSPSALPQVEQAIVELYTTLATETAADALANLTRALDRTERLTNVERVAGDLAKQERVPLDKITAGIAGLPDTPNRSALLNVLRETGVAFDPPSR